MMVDQMIFITSRGYKLPSFDQVEQLLWFNIWSKKLWPYSRLNINDTLYWYETLSKCIIWETVVTEIERFPFENKKDAFKILRNKFGPFDEKQLYCLNAPNFGYCLAYKVKLVKKLTLPKPDGFKFPRIGWLLGDESLNEWLGK